MRSGAKYQKCPSTSERRRGNETTAMTIGRRIRRTCVPYATYTVRLKLQWTDRRVKGERALSPCLPLSLSFSPRARYASLFLLFRRAAPPSPRTLPTPDPSFGHPSRSPSPRPLVHFALSFLRDPRRPRTRNKKVIGSRYKGEFLRGIFKRKLGFFVGPRTVRRRPLFIRNK